MVHCRYRQVDTRRDEKQGEQLDRLPHVQCGVQHNAPGVLGEAGIEHGYKLAEAAFYNYFLRPALNDGGSKGFNPEGIDNEVAGVAMTGVIDRLNPDLVVFLSKKAYDEFTKYCRRCGLEHGDVIIAAVAHPASP